MADDKEPKEEPWTARLSVRMRKDYRKLVEQAAEREGLQVSSFVIMLFVRWKILPEDCMKKLKRRPVPFYNALHELLGVINNIGGNCKQLIAVMPDIAGLSGTHMCIIRASAFLMDAVQGAPIPEGINLYRLQENILKEGLRFNQIVKSVNVGKPNITDLPETFAAIRIAADAITASLTGNPIEDSDDLMEMALSEMRANIKKAAAEQAKRNKGNS